MTSETDDSKQPVLDDVSSPAWQAYNAMYESKQKHYELLEKLDNKKKKFNLDPTQEDQAELAQHLANHDEQVKLFTEAAINLKLNHPESHKKLFEFIAKLGDGKPSQPVKH